MVMEIVVSFFMVTMTRKQFDCLSSVTLSTHATVNFLKHLPTLVFGINILISNIAKIAKLP